MAPSATTTRSASASQQRLRSRRSAASHGRRSATAPALGLRVVPVGGRSAGAPDVRRGRSAPGTAAPGGAQSLGGVGVIELEDCPSCVDPVLIAAFEGWNDAGDAATGAVEHLETCGTPSRSPSSTPTTTTTSRSTGRTVGLGDGRRRQIAWPTTRFSVAPAARARAATWCSCAASSRTCAGGLLRRAPRRSATSSASSWS